MSDDTRRSRPRRRLSRQAKIWGSLATTLVCAAAITWAALRVESARDTDLADERTDVSANYRHGVPDNAPPFAFEDVAEEVGLDFVHGPGPRARLLTEDTGSGLAWGDYDNDGDPDLYVVDLATSDGARAGRNRLFRNDGGRFTDVTDEAGVGDPSGMGMGASFADFDDDGDLDLYVTNVGANRMFRSSGDGTFEEVAAELGTTGAGWSIGCAWGDFDRDGRLDLYVCNYVDYDVDENEPFEEAATSGKYLAPPRLNPKVWEPQPNHLFRQKEDGTFEDVAAAAGVDGPEGRSMEAAVCDFDGDGLLDVYVANDVSPNALFLNRSGDERGNDTGREEGDGDGGGGGGGDNAGTGAATGSAAETGTGHRALRFVNHAIRTGTADVRGSMGVSVGDVFGPGGDPDGVPDVFVTHWVAQQNALYQGFRGEQPGSLSFVDKARSLRLGEVSTSRVGWGCAFVDVDRDGRDDLIVANGSTLERHDGSHTLLPQRPFLFWNDGERFHDLAPIAGTAATAERNARGLAIADYDADGDPDVAINVNRGRLVLLRNDTPAPDAAESRTITVQLDAPAALCFGARVTVTNGTETKTKWYAADTSYASGHDRALRFMSPAPAPSRDTASTVRVTWTNGETSTGEISTRTDRGSKSTTITLHRR